MTQRVARRFVYFSIAVLAAWAVVGLWLVPHLIRQAYRGESLSFLNAMLAGRGSHPVESYLRLWRGMALQATAGLVVLLGVVYLGLRFPDGRRRLVRWVVGGKRGITVRAFVWYAAFWGVFGGLAEATFRGVRQWITAEPATGFYQQLFWMAPVASGLAAVLVAGMISVLARAGETKVGVWKATVLFAFFAVYGVVQSRGIPLYPAAEVIASLGLATVAARLAEGHADALERGILRGRRYLAGVLGALAVFAFLSLPSIREIRARRGRAAAAGDLPNILLIILDTVRASNLSLYGYHRTTTPRIDEWAASGTVFDLAVATSPWTLPTHATIFTGRYNDQLRTSSLRPLDGRFPTLAEVLAEHGYATAGFVANLVFTTETSGLQRGFERYEAHPLTVGGLVESAWLSRMLLRRVRPWAGGLLDWGSKPAREVGSEFLQWVTKERGRPFFAFLNFFDAHEPYPLTPFTAALGPSANESWDDFSAGWRSGSDDRPFAEQMRPWLNQYDGALAYLDEEVGAILDTLAARGILQHTLVVLASDHGESFGEHGLISHRNSLYLDQLHVPLVISYPGVVPSDRRIARDVSVRDVAATVLDLVGLGTQSPIPGHSLAGLWATDTAAVGISPRLAELELEAGNDMPWAPVSRGDMEGLIEGSWHYIRNGDGVEELYDVHADPDEVHDVAGLPGSAGVLARLRAGVGSVTRSGHATAGGGN